MVHHTLCSVWARFRYSDPGCIFILVPYMYNYLLGERYDFVINADQPIGAYWIQLRGLGECGIKRSQQLAILRYARGPYQPQNRSPTYDVGLPQGIVSLHNKI
ncbi:hypothetical protein QAD02_021273 [Eretmocerus hayati]|uniref:Uncharacterized protein n=1 Tax=Eretmocerus hayati TaxID=131215 RepID=A0ACC2PPF4_9HYME|nr:hypothetical protein QAD02_021273 [Eretmocerus hayati]